MPSKSFTSSFEKKSLKSNQPPPNILIPSSRPETPSFEGKPLPPTPKPSTGVLRHLLSDKRNSLALPRVMGSFNRGMKRVRRHSLVVGGLGFTIPPSPTTDCTETVTKTNTTTPPLLTSSEVEPEMAIAECGEKFGHEAEDEEAEIGVAVEMTIVPVRARLIYIGCKGSDS